MDSTPEQKQKIVTDRTEQDIKIMVFLIQENGLSRTLRYIQYALERIAQELLLPMSVEKQNEAAKYLKAVEELEAPYEKIKNEIKL
jgi:antitoxin component of RelBE/YafQ-DinJ toxin-antitoxin module